MISPFSKAEKNSKDKKAGTRSGMFVPNTKRFYCKFPPKAKQEDKEEIMMGTVLAYMNPTTSALDYFALLSQPYWSDLGLHLTSLDCYVTTLWAGGERLICVGPGRQLTKAGSPPVSPACAVFAGDDGSASQATSSPPSSNSRPRRSTTLPKWEWGILDLRTVVGDADPELVSDFFKVFAKPINGGKLGDVVGTESLRLNGWAGDQNPRLEFAGELVDEATDPENYKIIAANPGLYSISLGRKIWQMTMSHRAKLLDGTAPASQAIAQSYWMGRRLHHRLEGWLITLQSLAGKIWAECGKEASSLRLQHLQRRYLSILLRVQLRRPSRKPRGADLGALGCIRSLAVSLDHVLAILI
eukprot:g3427.t1